MDNELVRELPNRGTCENMLKRLYNYINPVDSEWVKQIKPAAKEKIDKLIRVSRIREIGLNFPKSYIEFLEVMGENDGLLLSGWLRADTCIDRILEVYDWVEEDRKNGIEDEDFKERKFIIAYDDISEERYIKIFEDGSHKLISGYEEIYKLGFLYDDFEKMIFFSAFEKYEKKYFLCQEKFLIEEKIYEDKLKITEILDLLENFAIIKGFKKIWFSDSRHLVLAKKDITLYLKQEMSITGFAFGMSKDKLVIMISELIDFLKFQINKING